MKIIMRFQKMVSKIKKKFQNIEFVANGGWHFSNMKSAEEIETKLKTYQKPPKQSGNTPLTRYD